MIRADEQQPLQIGMPLTTGDRLGTSLGRVEIALDGGVLLHLDHHTPIDLLADDLVRMLDGRLRVTVDVGSGARPRIDTPETQVVVREAGELTIARTAERTRVNVVRGSVAVGAQSEGVTMRAGESTSVDPLTAPATPRPFNTAQWDRFDRWIEQRRVARIARYAPQLIRTRLSPVPGHRTAPTTTPPARQGGDARLHPLTWAPTVPWLVGGTFCCPQEDDRERAPGPIVVVVPIPAVLPAPPPSFRSAGLRLPATARPVAGRTVGAAPRFIVLPRGGSATTASPASSSGATTAGRSSSHATNSTRSTMSTVSGGDAPRTVLRPGMAAPSPRTPARSSRAERVGSRSARRSSERP